MEVENSINKGLGVGECLLWLGSSRAGREEMGLERECWVWFITERVFCNYGCFY